MVVSVRCKNFYSIGEEILVDFSVNGKAPDKKIYKDAGVPGYDRRVSLVNVMIGPNASGKTNVLKVIAFLKHLIVDSLDDSSGGGVMYYIPHMLHFKEPIEVSAKFAMEKVLYEYSFVLDINRILSEKIIKSEKAEVRFTEKKVFERAWEGDGYKIKVDKLFGIALDELRENASVVSTARRLPKKYAEAEKIASYWENQVVVFEPSALGIFDNPAKALRANGRREELEKMLEDEKIKEKVDELLAGYDVGYVDIKKRVVENGILDEAAWTMYDVIHEYGDKTFSVGWGSESSGTKRMVKILVDVVKGLLAKNATVVIDELDAFLHPDIVWAIVDLFLDPEVNKNGTQLIFSTHSHRVLTVLDKQEIFLVEKNDVGETEVWRLDDVEGVRADDNYYRRYISGEYGAKPRI